MAPAYAPLRPGDTGLAPRRSSTRWVVRAVLGVSLVVLGYYAAVGFRTSHLAATSVRKTSTPPADTVISTPDAAELSSDETEDPTGLGLTPETLAVLLSLPSGPYVRDVYPARTLRAFLSLSEAEIASSPGTEACGGRLGSSLISAWSSTARSCCKPEPERGPVREAELRSASRRSLLHDDPQDFERGQQGITCFDPRDGRRSSWWAAGAYPCVSEWLESEGNVSEWRTDLECSLPRSREGGALVNHLEQGESRCERREEAVLVVRRRDQWNPFHAAEDLLSALMSLLTVTERYPELHAEKFQLAFSDDFAISGNSYASLWDRIGARTPRVTALDPYGPHTCFRRVVHSPGGPSILTVVPVHKFSGCASAITWAGSHYLRYLFGYPPPALEGVRSGGEVGERVQREGGGVGRRGGGKRVVRVLFLSRLKLDRYFFRSRQYTHWRGTRHIYNEPELLGAIASGLGSLCSSAKCSFEDVSDDADAYLRPPLPSYPDSLHPPHPGSNPDYSNEGSEEVVLRFGVLDPLTVPLDSQVAYLSQTDVVVGSHGGALALSLFMPPGKGAMVELQVDEIYERNFHFKNLSYQLGRRYKELLVDNEVETGPVVDAVKEMVRAVVEEK